MKYLFCILIGYFIGTINPSYIIARLRGFDIREKGSKNAGASNALMLLGKMFGVGCALFDIAKVSLSIWLCRTLFPSLSHVFAVTGVSCVLGHIFPIFMKFRGGKGLSSLGGMVLAFDWRLFFIMLATELIVAILTNYLCFVSITASLAFPVIYGFLMQDLWGALIIGILFPVIFYKHVENLRRIKQGTEMPFCVLWNKEKALSLMQQPPEE